MIKEFKFADAIREIIAEILEEKDSYKLNSKIEELKESNKSIIYEDEIVAKNIRELLITLGEGLKNSDVGAQKLEVLKKEKYEILNNIHTFYMAQKLLKIFQSKEKVEELIPFSASQGGGKNYTFDLLVKENLNHYLIIITDLRFKVEANFIEAFNRATNKEIFLKKYINELIDLNIEKKMKEYLEEVKDNKLISKVQEKIETVYFKEILTTLNLKLSKPEINRNYSSPLKVNFLNKNVLKTLFLLLSREKTNVGGRKALNNVDPIMELLGEKMTKSFSGVPAVSLIKERIKPLRKKEKNKKEDQILK